MLCLESLKKTHTFYFHHSKNHFVLFGGNLFSSFKTSFNRFPPNDVYYTGFLRRSLALASTFINSNMAILWVEKAFISGGHVPKPSPTTPQSVCDLPSSSCMINGTSMKRPGPIHSNGAQVFLSTLQGLRPDEASPLVNMLLLVASWLQVEWLRSSHR